LRIQYDSRCPLSVFFFRSRVRGVIVCGNGAVTQILSAIEQGDPHAAEQLLPLVYEELRKLAAQRLAQEKPGQTMQATALVHEAYLRLVASPRREPASPRREPASPRREPGEAAPRNQRWDSRGHFYAAAAEAMRRILVESARRKKSLKRGGGRQRAELLDAPLPVGAADERLIDLDLALDRFAAEQPRMAQLVKLRFFGGLTLEEVADTLRISLRTAKRDWTFARAWLRREMDREK